MTDKNQAKSRTAATAFAALSALLLATGCGDGNNSVASASSDAAQSQRMSPARQVTTAATASVSGKITYDFVPAVSNKGRQGQWLARLDYASTVQKPARNIVVELLNDKSGKVLLSTTTDDQGNYSFQAPLDTAVHVRAKAQMLRSAGKTSGPSWNFAVRDNSSDGYGTAVDGAALFAMDGASFNSGKKASIHDLNAASGWDAASASYANSRSAAPFAILDTIYSASHKVLEADQNLSFPPLNIFWSPGSDDGTFFGSQNGKSYSKGLHIRGHEDVDTDEYDAGVIAHEWGHYFQATFSRDDSIAGPHSGDNLLDMRLAFSEGWGNAFSSMARSDPMYVDTQGQAQANAAVVFKVDEIPDNVAKAWFGEVAVQSVLYRLHQSPDIGFKPIYQAMAAQKKSPAFTSLFSFATSLRGSINPAGQATLDNLLAEINTANKNQLDMFGLGQFALPPSIVAGNKDFVLPIYATLEEGVKLKPAKDATVCTTGAYGKTNKLGINRYLRFRLAQKGKHTLHISADAGLYPSFQLFSKGDRIAGNLVQDPNSASAYNVDYDLPAQDDYVATINAGDKTGCFKITLAPTNAGEAQ
ncbi:Phage tail fiber protein [Collimonas arenae]|uniref:Phage tail fiber protein n=1 Tax=Collimonas arenae TaxID=279058 RepID=A0A0A1FBE4_9BURK|nr:hypothetical protein [Collimonas arenae]AIY41085.1 Phage tail fiber protein [Collimonas arenae]